MPPQVFYDARTVLLLDDLELHKGETGKYMVAKDEAYAGARDKLQAADPHLPITTAKIHNKLSKLASAKYSRAPSDRKYLLQLFREGIDVLPRAYLESLDPKYMGRGRARSSHKRKRAARNSKSPSPSTMTPRSAKVLASCKISKFEPDRPINDVLLPKRQVQSCWLHALILLLTTQWKDALFHKGIEKQGETMCEVREVRIPAIVRNTPEVKSPRMPTASPLSPVTFPCNQEKDTSKHELERESAVPTLKLSIKQRERLANIDRYLEKDPDAFVPGRQSMSQIQGEILQGVQRSVRQLFQLDCEPQGSETAKALHQVNHTKLSRALSDTEFLSFCRVLFPAKTSHEVREMFLRAKIASEDFLRAILAAAIHTWVLDDGHAHSYITSQLLHKSKAARIFEGEIAEVCPELHHQAMLKSRHVLVNESLDFSEYSNKLADNFDDAVMVFLQENGVFQIGPRWQEWRTNIRSVFQMAFKLKALVVLRDRKEYFHMPLFGDVLDRAFLRAEEFGDGDEGYRVKIALFPALREQSSPYRAGEDLEMLAVVHGVVILE